jgi:dsDNA-specific endonuclease/ATPase MutS2
MRGRVGKIIFIHGVGQGRLKFEITKILNNKYPDMKYQDASFREYGYGAIMVIL